MNRSGFTLAEIIAVIIILSVLASLALPRIAGNVEVVRAGEALATLNAMHEAIEACYLERGVYSQCNQLTDIDIEIPHNSDSGGDWNFTTGASSLIGAGSYMIRAHRQETNGGNSTDFVRFDYATDPPTIVGQGPIFTFTQ